MLKVATLGLIVLGTVVVAQESLSAREVALQRTRVQRFFGYGYGEGIHAYSCCDPCPDYYQRQVPLAAPVFQSSIYQSTRGVYPYLHQRYRGWISPPSPFGPANSLPQLDAEDIATGTEYHE
ncbi:MAG: hypothetical protein R3C10_18235 [Pirellulales bacterium]|nr:hypothetical protein [Planctomycetales bacterium]